MPSIFNVSHRKVGALHFVKCGRFGFSFWLSQPREEHCAVRSTHASDRSERFSVLDRGGVPMALNRSDLVPIAIITTCFTIAAFSGWIVRVLVGG